MMQPVAERDTIGEAESGWYPVRPLTTTLAVKEQSIMDNQTLSGRAHAVKLLRQGRGRHGNHARGESHPRWNGGRTVGSNGYEKIQVGRGHPLADPNGYVYAHLLAWVNAGNPKPEPDEVIHHINGNKRDNRIENLRIESRSAHSAGHHHSLSDATVRMIREMYASGAADMPTLSVQFRVPVARVSKFIRGETRLSAGGPVSTSNRGKKAAGRLLDGRTWDEMPEVTR